MLKWLAIFVVFVSLASLPAANAAGPSADNAQTSVKVTQLPTVSVTRDCLDWLALIFSGGLLLVGFFGVQAANRTLKVIERQTNHMVASERAWITAVPSQQQQTAFFAREQEISGVQGDDPRPRVLSLQLEFKNIGKTPARLDEIAMDCKYIEHEPSKLPENPEYKQFRQCNKELFVPDSSTTWYTQLSESDRMLSRSQIEKIKANQSFLYVYGIVKYRDILGDLHETAFGFSSYFPPDYKLDAITGWNFRPDGPPAYNQAT